MFLLDVNVVVAAFRGDHPHRAAARPWFEGVVASGEAFVFLDTVVGHPNRLLIGPGPRHLAILRQVCDDADASGDLVPDTVLAAIATEHGCTIATFDRDFTRFSGVEHHLLRA